MKQPAASTWYNIRIKMEEKVWRREIKTYEENVDEENVDEESDVGSV